MNSNKIPIDIIISSFRGELSPARSESFREWLSEEGNDVKYAALQKVWHQTIINAGEFNVRKGYNKFRNRVSNAWKTTAVAAFITAAVTLVFVFLNLSVPKMSSSGTQEYICMSGKSRVALPDGTIVTLHKNAKLSYNQYFSSSARTVNLDGEAYFDVVSDPDNPFVVAIDDIDIIVYGTTFNVMEDDQSVTVSLLEGSLDVKAGENVVCTLVPGHEVVYDKETRSLVEGSADVAFASCWAQDRLTFTQASLGEVCRYMSKWYGVEIIMPESLGSSGSYTFTIRDESIDQILDIMKRINPIGYRYTNDNRIIISEIL